jgi:hypothetical protein
MLNILFFGNILLLLLQPLVLGAIPFKEKRLLASHVLF